MKTATEPDSLIDYALLRRKKQRLIRWLFLGCLGAVLLSILLGASSRSLKEIGMALLMRGDATTRLLLWQIRLPRITGALIAGAGLALSGCVMQNILNNPLASPSTLGVSSGAAFGANLAIILFRAGDVSAIGRGWLLDQPYLISLSAFVVSLSASVIVLALARLRRFSPEAILLAGVALSSIFSAGTAILQYFASDTQLSAAVFWSFGDLGRINWHEIGWLTPAVLIAGCLFSRHSWDYNALAIGEAGALSLGVQPKKLRLVSMLGAAALTSLCVSFIGLIGFVGLIAPQAMRRLIGGDHRYLIPASALAGAIVLLLADTLARTVLSPIVLPVGAITALLGGPMFLYLLMARRRQNGC
ncbi:MAG TPA: iron ABC transporter permease [Tissierellia bacterium]|nr:iron ABC transporter permease [Tissierellia bacterium]